MHERWMLNAANDTVALVRTKYRSPSSGVPSAGEISIRPTVTGVVRSMSLQVAGSGCSMRRSPLTAGTTNGWGPEPWADAAAGARPDRPTVPIRRSVQLVFIGSSPLALLDAHDADVGQRGILFPERRVDAERIGRRVDGAEQRPSAADRPRAAARERAVLDLGGAVEVVGHG